MTHGLSKEFELVFDIRTQHPRSYTDSQTCKQAAVFVELDGNVIFGDIPESPRDDTALRGGKGKGAGDFNSGFRLPADGTQGLYLFLRQSGKICQREINQPCFQLGTSGGREQAPGKLYAVGDTFFFSLILQLVQAPLLQNARFFSLLVQ
jgi:hypothetical protein